MHENFEVTDYLLFLTHLDGLRILGYNLKGESFLKSETDKKEGYSEFFYKDILHPDDYSRFITQLESFQDLEPYRESKGIYRIRTPQGEWEEYEFSHRPYRGNLSDCIIGLGKKISTTESGKKEERSLNAYKMLLDSLDEAFCRIDMVYNTSNVPIDYLFLETNPAFEKHVALNDVVGKSMQELVPDHEEHWYKIYGEVAAKGKPKRFQELAQNIKGTWFNVYAFPIGPTAYPQVAILFSNITENKKVETRLKQMNQLLETKVALRKKELTENSELLQTVFDNSNQGIAVFEPIFEEGELVDFIYLRVNTLIKKIFRNRDLVEKKFSQFFYNDEDLGIWEALKTTMVSGRINDFEIHYNRKGYDNWFRVIARRKSGLLIVAVEDITRRKLESQRLKESIRFKKHLTGASPDIIMIFNLYDENIRYINRDMSAAPGMKKKDILGKNLLEVVPFIHPRDREKGLDFHNKIISAKDKDVLEMEFRLRSEKGRYTWYNALGKVFMRNKKGNVYEYMILLRNIDEQKETQKALIAAEKLSIKGEIARTFAHELRNPLASIGMASDILQKKIAEEDEQAKNLLKIIKRSTKTLNDLVTDLLTTSNYSPSILEKNCLARILEDCLKMAKDRIYLSGIKVVKNYKGNYYIHADEEKLKIALMNIIVNASEAMVPDEGILNFRITKKNEDFILSVSDNGCGLEKEQLEKLFDAFYTQKPNGMGVGLSSVKSILEEHDAKIEVFSEPNKGTTFNLSFHCYENFERS